MQGVNVGGRCRGKPGQHIAEAVDHVGQARQIAFVRHQPIVDERAQVGLEFERRGVDVVQAEALAGQRDLVDLVAEFARSRVLPAVLGQWLPAPYQGKTAFAQFGASLGGAFEHVRRILTAHCVRVSSFSQAPASVAPCAAECRIYRGLGVFALTFLRNAAGLRSSLARFG